jgi:uncharacterized protein (TIGR04255 family)
MDKYDDVCYKKTFLKEVIFRIDFPSPIQGMEKSLPGKLSKAALKAFPIFEPQKTHSQEFQFSGPNIQTRTTEAMQWVFHGNEREKTLTINPKAIIMTVRKYLSFETMEKDVRATIETLFSEYPDLNASRVGLRFVNLLETGDSDPLSWCKYVNEKMLGIFDFPEDRNVLTRVFHILEFNYEGQALKYQFGIANPDYPAIIKRRQFVLDLDSYSHGGFDVSGVITVFHTAHERIQDLFEKSITDETRTLMKKTKNG